MRRQCALLVALLLILALPACTVDDADDAGTTTAAPTSPPAPAATDPGDPEADPPSADAAGGHIVTLQLASATVPARDNVDIWSNANEAVAVGIAPDGSVWTTGPGGTTRWDVSGGSAAVFTAGHGLGASNGRALAISPDGSVFVAHGAFLSDGGEGISVFDGASWTHHTVAEGLPSDSVLDLAVAPDGTVWMASYTGLAYYDDGSWNSVTDYPEPFDLALSPDGELRAQTEDGVIVIGGQGDLRITTTEPLPGWEALPGEGAVIDQDGSWWFQLWGVGLVRRTPAGMEVHVIDEYLGEYREAADSGDIARAVLLPGLEMVFGAKVTSDGEIWALGAPGVLRLSDGEWVRLDAEGTSNVTLYDVVSDGQGGHWLATDGGLVHIDHDDVATTFAVEATVGTLVSHVAIGPAGVFASSFSGQPGRETVTVSHLAGDGWTAVGEGELARIEPSSEPDHFGLDQDGYPVVFRDTAYRVLNGSDWVEPEAPYSRALTRPTVDGNGILWADAGDGIWYLAEAAWQVVPGSGELPVTGLAPRAEGGVWLATWDQGVFVVDASGISQLPSLAPELRRVTAIVAGGDGSVWIVGNSEGGTELANSDGSSWRRVPVPRWDGAFDWVTCLTVGPDGAVWIGDGDENSAGFGSGVARFLDDTWTRYGTASGLPSSSVYSIAVDDGSLWVGTDAGVARLAEPTPQSEEAAPTITSTPPTTTLAAAYSIATNGDMPEPLPGSDGYLGSGCAPGSDTLPDGIWFGFVRDVTETSIAFDLVCLRWLEDPNDDAIEEGGWDLSNINPKIRDVPVAAGAQATCPWFGCPQLRISYAEWTQRTSDFLAANPDATAFAEGQYFGVLAWLYVNDGRVTEIAEPVLAG